MVTTNELFQKHLTRALLTTVIVMVVLLVVSIIAKVKFIGDAPLVAGVVALVFSCALHSAIKEAAYNISLPGDGYATFGIN